MKLFKIVVVLLSVGNVLGGSLFVSTAHCQKIDKKYFSNQVEQVIFFDKFESCKSGLQMDFLNVTMGKDASRKTLINATIRISRDFDGKVEV